MEDVLSTVALGRLAGTDGLSPRKVVKLSALMVRHHFGYRFGCRRDSATVWITTLAVAVSVLVWAWPQGRISAVWLAVAAAAAVMLMFVALVVACLALSLWSSRRCGTVLGYFDATATQIVHCHGSTWTLDKHFAVHPGRGEAATFRRRVFTHVATQADHQGAIVTMSTRMPTLRDRYLIEMPGLEVAASRRGTWHLERPPQKC